MIQSQDHLSDLHAATLLSDARFLMRDYHIPISMSALQVYYSGLVSMPECGLRALPLDVVFGKLVSDRHRGWRTRSLILEGHTEPIRSVAFSSDGSQIISGSDDNTVRVWDAVSGEAKHTLSGHTSLITSVAFSPEGSQIISSSDDDTVRVWDANTGAPLHHSDGCHVENIATKSDSVSNSPSHGLSDPTLLGSRC
jgi:WD40 repeat protein